MKEKKTHLIDLATVEGKVYSGRERGELLRKEFQLDLLDQGTSSVAVKFPPETYSVTSSFFLGLFGPSVISCGSIEKFFTKFKFENPDFLAISFEDFAERAFVGQSGALIKRKLFTAK